MNSVEQLRSAEFRVRDAYAIGLSETTPRPYAEASQATTTGSSGFELKYQPLLVISLISRKQFPELMTISSPLL